MNSLLRGKKLETESFSGSNVPHSEALTIVIRYQSSNKPVTGGKLPPIIGFIPSDHRNNSFLYFLSFFPINFN